MTDLVPLFIRNSATNIMGCHTMLRIERFCCCSTLRTGSLIIGYLGLMAYFIQVVAGSVQLSFVHDYYSHHYANNTRDLTVFQFYYSRLAAMAIAYNSFLTLASALMLWGVHKAKSDFILPWLVVKVVNFFILLIAILIATIQYVAMQGAGNVGFFIIMGIFTFCIWLAVYMYACVFSHYKELKCKEEGANEDSIPPPYNITILEEKKEPL